MPAKKLFRLFTALSGAIILASCADPLAPTLSAPTSVDGSHNSGSNKLGSSLGSATDAAGVELRAIWWSKHHKSVVRVSKTIGPDGGTISIPETGLKMEFPAGSLSSALTITVTADEKYVAYKMEPSGTRFLKDVTVTQSLGVTELKGSPLRSLLYAAYIADDNIKLSGKVPVLEIEASKTIFSPLSGLPEAQVWVIRHFSRYMLASD
jgi:hypothetical protein